MEKYTKKANATVMKQVLKVNPNASGRTTFDQAYVILMTEWDLEGDLVSTTTETTFKVWRDGEVCHTLTWPKKKSFNEKEGDWDWDLIYKDVLQVIIKEKLYKRPKLGKRAAAKLAKEKEEAAKKAEALPKKEAAENAAKKEKAAKKASAEKDIELLKKRKKQLYMKIYNDKKKGIDTSHLQKEHDELVNRIKNFNI
jgi:predicted SprT family Zn-dependent metalloprotease